MKVYLKVILSLLYIYKSILAISKKYHLSSSLTPKLKLSLSFNCSDFNYCNNHGQCINESCQCDKGYGYFDCSIQICENSCSKKGHCESGVCICEENYFGIDCSHYSLININSQFSFNVKDFHDFVFKSKETKLTNKTNFINNLNNYNITPTPSNISNNNKTSLSAIIGDSLTLPQSSNTTSQLQLQMQTQMQSKPCPICQNEGICDPITGKCLCFNQYQPPDCSIILCPNNCSNHGICNNITGKCTCNPHYNILPDCSLKEEEEKNNNECSNNSMCLNNCSNHGICYQNHCICESGYNGIYCSHISCPNECSYKGKCLISGICQCDLGYLGADCSVQDPDCLSFTNCSNHGVFINGSCLCDEVYNGPHCENIACKDNCSNNGICINGTCFCDQNWTGLTCENSICFSSCFSNGYCNSEGMCECFQGFSGLFCEFPLNKTIEGISDVIINEGNHCINGIFLNNVCFCYEGWTGLNCEIPSCLNECSFHGICDHGVCKCNRGFRGKDCSIRYILHGHYIEKYLFCDRGWTGVACDELICENNCSNRGFCRNGTCECYNEFYGKVCERERRFNLSEDKEVCYNKNTSNHYIIINGSRYCESGFSGVNCDIPIMIPSNIYGNNATNVTNLKKSSNISNITCIKCPKNCSNHGICTNKGICYCENGYKGSFCELKACPNDCSMSGICLSNGSCLCLEGYKGQDCGERWVVNGIIINKTKVLCDKGYIGITCNKKECNCSKKGICVLGKCYCKKNFYGVFCEYEYNNEKKTIDFLENQEGILEKTIEIIENNNNCPKNCSNHGICSAGQCYCERNDLYSYTGDSCQFISCLNNCNNHGDCLSTGMCSCNKGYKSIDCSEKYCPSDPITKRNCSGNGICYRNQCICDKDYIGIDCSQKVCKDNCFDKGICFNGICYYNEKFYLDKNLCSHNCSNHGKCLKNGDCICNNPFYGRFCDESPCFNECSRHGICLKGKCFCEPGFSGSFCQFKLCNQSCYNGGICYNNNLCNCSIGFGGLNCEKRICPNNCSFQGICVNNTGVCRCFDGFLGLDCGFKRCLDDCSGHGVCSNGTCYCAEGFNGIKCQFEQCEDDCSGNGDCISGECKCFKGYYGRNCSVYLQNNQNVFSFSSNCNLRGVWYDGICFCEGEFTGINCEILIGEHSFYIEEEQKNIMQTIIQKECLKNCNYPNGFCLNQTCLCREGYIGRNCDIISPFCNLTCENEGVCIDNRCVCKKGFFGLSCGEKCSNCSNNGVCIEGVCYCEEGFSGGECQIKEICVEGCSNRGICRKKGKCDCNEGYHGDYCQFTDCLNNCSGKGECKEEFIDSRCSCDNGWAPPDCSRKVCSGNGVLVLQADRSMACSCYPSFYGADCNYKNCPYNCSNNGVCTSDGKCNCFSGFEGQLCETKISCPFNCSNQGSCYNEKCLCSYPYEGPFCQEIACKGVCLNNGTCNKITGVCECKNEYIGDFCETVLEENKENVKWVKDSFEKNDCNNCSEHGICINRTTCYCDSRFEGVYCELQIFDLKRIECNLKCYGSCLENNKQNIAYECFGECLKKNCLNVSKNFKGDQNNNINGVENKIGRHEEKENNKDYLEFSSESF